MSNSFDPYLQWLGIRDPQRPPNLYRLLGVDLFESDVDVIESAADRQMAHLRTFQNGPHAETSQRLLNEIAAAKVCLLTPSRKSTYDDQLRAQQPPREPPLAAPGELPGEDVLDVVVEPDPVTLRTPGRGPRVARPWYASMKLLLPLLALLLSFVTYRIYRDHAPSSAAQPIADDRTAEAPITKEPSLSGAPDSEVVRNDERVDTSTRDELTDVAADRSPVPADVSDVAESPSEEPSPSDVTTESQPATDPDSVSANADAPSPPGWNEAALSRPRPAGSIYDKLAHGRRPAAALSQRDLAAADGALQALRLNQALGLPESLFQEAELVRDAIAQFWQAVDQAQSDLKAQDTLVIAGVPVTVVSRDGTSVTLAAPTGQQHSFDLRLRNIHPDLAVALVESHYRTSPATAWRLIATCLAVDHQGDVRRANEFAQQAEWQGFAAEFLPQLVRHLSGDDVSDAPPLSFPVPAAPAHSNDEPDVRPTDAPDASEGLPDSAAMQQARREVLSPILVELRQQEVPVERWPQELLARADSPELDEAARYALLDNALKRARSRRDVDAALAVIDVIARDFGQDRADLRYELLQYVTRRLKGEDRRRYAEFAEQLARDAVDVDDYEQAIRFASLAQSIGRSVPDRAFRKQLLDFRLEIDAIQAAFASLKSMPSGPDAGAAAGSARFKVLAKGDFVQGLQGLRDTADAALAELVKQELAPPTSAEQQLKLARGWFQFAEKLSGVEKVNSLRRARYWFRACDAKLSRVERVQVQQDLDAITSVLGRDSDQLDLTGLSPVEMRVGYGTFGINKNIDAAANPKVAALPQLDGVKISRFLWACAPSRIEYLLPSAQRALAPLGWSTLPLPTVFDLS